MRGLDLGRPPRWGILALVLLAVANVVGVTSMALRGDMADSYARTESLSAGSTAALPAAPASSSPTTKAPTSVPPGTAVGVPVLAVYGDGYAAGNEQGGVGPAGWPALVATATGTELSLHASPRTGYVAVGASGSDFGGLVAGSPVPEAAVTLVVGSRNDADQDVEAVHARAVETISAVRAASPQAVIVIIGPVWDDADVPAKVIAVRDAVQAAARSAGVQFVDPLAAAWFADPNGLISPDGVSPNDAGHAYLADLIKPVVIGALDEFRTSN